MNLVSFACGYFTWPLSKIVQNVLVEKKKETITESAGRQQKKKIGKWDY